MTLPGTPGGEYVADGLEHAPGGRPSTAAEDHAAQMDKRQRKLTNFNYGNHWADIEGDGELAVVTWGSVTGQVREALHSLAVEGITDTRLISMRLLAPALPEAFAEAMAGATRVLVVEQTHSGQFAQYLRANYNLPEQVRVLHRAGPLPIQVDEIRERIKRWYEI
jgi:2-oxoglutarate ferredoxin oxidoreductase subunit alpha